MNASYKNSIMVDSINETSIVMIDRKLFSETISGISMLDNITKNVDKNLSSWIQNIMVRVFPLYLIIFLLAVIGNVLVILTLVQNKRMRTVTNLFLLNLAISDLLLGIFCMPFTLVGMLLRDFIFGEIMCKLLPYLQGGYQKVFLATDLRGHASKIFSEDDLMHEIY